MSDEKKRTRDALLGELESIKHLLNEEQADAEPPLLTTALDTDSDDTDPPLLTEALNSVIDEIRESTQSLSEDSSEESWEESWDDESWDEEALPVLENPVEAEAEPPTLTQQPNAADTAAAELDERQLPDEDDQARQAVDSQPEADDPIEETLIDDADSDGEDLVARALRARQTAEARAADVAPLESGDERHQASKEAIAEDTEALEADTTETAAAATANAPAPSDQATKEHQPSLFDPPAPVPGKASNQSPSTASTQAPEKAQHTGYTRPTIKKTENPFLPKHIRDRLHTNRSLQQEIASGTPYHRATDAEPAAKAEEQLVERVLHTVMPKIEQELREKIRQLIDEERAAGKDTP